MTEFVCRAPEDDPRQPLMAARLHSLQARWDLAGASAPAGPRPPRLRPRPYSER